MASIRKLCLACLLTSFTIWTVIYVSLPSSRGKNFRRRIPETFLELPKHNETAVRKNAAESKTFRSSIKKEAGFLNLLKGEGVIPVLIEQKLLVHLLTDEERFALIKRNIPINKFSNYNNITTYGIFETISANINENLVRTMKDSGYEYGKIESLDARYFHWDGEKHKNVAITGHHFFLKSQHVHHLVILYSRGNFLWSPAISSLPTILSHLEVEDFSFGRYASGFEMFQTLTIQIGNTVVQTPSDVRRFLFEIATSQFKECNFIVAKSFYAKYRNESKQNVDLGEKGVEAINAVKELVRPFLIPFWIGSGTLLGWYRQCDIIPYTTDIDLATWSSVFSEALEERVKMNLNELVLLYVFGTPSESYQYSFCYRDLKVDFFYTYKEENSYHYGGHISSRKTYFHYIYPKFTLCSADLLGIKVLVPCKSEQVISAEYGNNWRDPVEWWSYDSSAFNLGPEMEWPSDIVEDTFKEYT